MILFLILAGMLFSCGKSKPSHSTVDASEIKEIVLSNNSTIYIQDWVTNVEVVPLETTDKALVGIIDGVIVTDSNIIIYDTRQTHCIFIFGRNGKHRTTINRRGRGPQEYSDLYHVAMLPDHRTLAIHGQRGKILYFSLDGRLISSAPAGFLFSAMEYIDGENVVCAAYGIGESDPGLQGYKNRTDLLYFTDDTFGIKGSTFPPRYNRKEIAITPNIRKFGERVYVHRPYSDTIYQALSNGLKALYRINMEKIDGAANLNSGITREERNLLQEKHPTFYGFFADCNNYLNLDISIPPRQTAQNYVYSKRTGKAYRVERDSDRQDYLLWQLTSFPPQTSAQDRFVTILPAYNIFGIGTFNPKTGVRKNAATQRPELAHLTENSNPVVVLYGFKEGL